MALAVNPGVPANTFEEFVRYAKSNPGKLKFGAPPGIYTHFAGEFFKIKTGTDILLCLTRVVRLQSLTCSEGTSTWCSIRSRACSLISKRVNLRRSL
jgi:hypothetical protein